MEDLCPGHHWAPATLDPPDERTTVPHHPADVRRLLPGLGAAALAVAAGLLVQHLLPSVSPLTVAIVLGAVVGNVGLPITALRPGLQLAAKRLLRIGIVLLGLRLAVPDVLALGLPMLAVVVATVVLTFVGTQWLARRCGLSRGTGLLMATGFSICGASAIAAMDGVTKNEESEVVTAITMVTLFGSLAILVLPALQGPLGLDDHRFGLWVGAGVHDVAQTVAAASVAGPVALASAVVVKLTRVVLLAPMVAGTSLYRRRTARTDIAASGTDTTVTRPPILPLFVAGFIAAVALRSTGWLPEAVLHGAQQVETVLLAAALFALGANVHLPTLVRTGGRAVFVGLLSWVLIAGIALAGVLLVANRA